jgi:hypothetical protein
MNSNHIKTSFWLILQTSESKLFVVVVVDVVKTLFSVVAIATFETIFLLISILLEIEKLLLSL